jgi:Protein of unknown function (DUF2934)
MKNPTEEQIRVRAYQIYLRQGKIPGQDAIHWFQAKKELQQLPDGDEEEANRTEKKTANRDRIEKTAAMVGLAQGKEIHSGGPPLVDASAIDVPVPEENGSTSNEKSYRRTNS